MTNNFINIYNYIGRFKADSFAEIISRRLCLRVTPFNASFQDSETKGID